jgi:pimeloyl-ACP methyl ester carboxylesterase
MNKSGLPEDKWFIDGDLKLHYLDWGNPNATTMLLVHGLCCEAHYWDFFAGSLRQDYHVIALDQRGHGESIWAGKYTLEQYADDLAVLIEGMDLHDIVLIGHSQGAINVLLCTANNTGRIARLVLVDNGPEINMEFVGKVSRGLVHIPAACKSEEQAIRLIKKLELPRYSREYAQHLVRHTMKADDTGKLIFKYDPALRYSELVNLEWLWPYIEKITCPVLVVRGMESPLLLREGVYKMRDNLPNVSLVEIENVGHFIMGENPEAFEAAIRDFLSGDSLQD